MRRRARPTTSKLGEIERVLRDGLGALSVEGSVRVTPGWRDNVHIQVVSPAFREMGWREREDLVWGILEASLREEVLGTISLLMLETPEEAPPDAEEFRQRHEALRAEVRERLERYRSHLSTE